MLCVGFGGGLPDLVQRMFCLGLHTLGKRIQHIAGFMDPTALLLDPGVDFLQAPQNPMAPSPIARQGPSSLVRSTPTTVPANAEWTHGCHLRSPRGASRLADSRQSPLTHTAVARQLGVHFNPVNPDIAPLLLIESLVPPGLGLLSPELLQSGHCTGRQVLGLRAHSHFQGRMHLTGGNPLQIQPGQGRFQASRLPHVRRDEG